MSKLIHRIFALILLLSFAACNNSAKGLPDLNGTDWILTSMPGADLPVSVEINLEFEAGRIAGTGVCNRYFSEYTLDGNRISLKAVAATEMMCAEHSDVEMRYFQALQGVTELTVNEDQLRLQTADGDLVFKAANTPNEM